MKSLYKALQEQQDWGKQYNKDWIVRKFDWYNEIMYRRINLFLYKFLPCVKYCPDGELEDYSRQEYTYTLKYGDDINIPHNLIGNTILGSYCPEGKLYVWNSKELLEP